MYMGYNKPTGENKTVSHKHNNKIIIGVGDYVLIILAYVRLYRAKILTQDGAM